MKQNSMFHIRHVISTDELIQIYGFHHWTEVFYGMGQWHSRCNEIPKMHFMSTNIRTTQQAKDSSQQWGKCKCTHVASLCE